MSWSCIRTKVVKTKRPHACCWCGQRIDVGSSVTCSVGTFDGEIQRNYWHPECEKDFSMAVKDDPWLGTDGFIFGTNERPVEEAGQ